MLSDEFEPKVEFGETTFRWTELDRKSIGDKSGDRFIKFGVKLRRDFNTDGVVLFDASKQRFIALGEKSNED